jgi:hypothetical protein
VVFTIDGTAQPVVGLTVSKGQATATFTTSTLGPGRHLVTATYAPQGNFGASSSNTVVENVIVPVTPNVIVAADGPEVTSVISQGYRKRRPTVLLTFNEALDPATARDVSAYHIMNPRGRALRIVSASYNAASHSVTIRTAHGLNRHQTYTLIVGGTGVTALKSATDVALDGKKTGHPGSDFVTRLRWAKRVRMLPHATGPARHDHDEPERKPDGDER